MEFKYFDSVEIVKECMTFGKNGIVDGYENGKIVVHFEPPWIGYYQSDDLKLIKREYEK